MLPLHASRASPTRRKTIINRLDLFRSRNASTAAFACLTIFSLLLNVHYWLNAKGVPIEAPTSEHTQESISNTLSRNVRLSHASHLIIVAGHGIWKGCDPQWRSDHEQWLLGPEAKDKSASVRLYFSHIVRGCVHTIFPRSSRSHGSGFGSAELVMNDPQAILIFSGYVRHALNVNYIRVLHFLP
jgi:hypothetical protein